MPTTAPTTRRSTSVPTRTYQLRRIHELARAAGFDTRPGSEGRVHWERFLTRLIGRTSTRQAVRSERELVIDELRRRTDGEYRITNARPVAPTSDADCAGIL